MVNRMRVYSIVAVTVLLLAACAGVQAGPQPEPGAIASPAGTERDITVIGVGHITLVPNIAKLSVGAEARAATVSEAKADVDAQMKAITDALKAMGIEEKDIQTAHYSIYYEQNPYQPVTREEGGTLEPEGAYRVSSMLEVTVRNVDQAGEVLDSVVAAGANQVYGVSFTVSDDQKWQGEARKKAMADARDRAGELAQLAGVELGHVLSISEVIGGGPVIAYAERAMGGGGGIAPGELEMTAQVQVTFAIQ